MVHYITKIFITILTFFAFVSLVVECRTGNKEFESMFRPSKEVDEGTKWAILVAGSHDYVNYRHQADTCHAYQLLKKGGLKDENIVVFMQDDIAYNPENPNPGTIINSPSGHDVYQGVPKDYTGKDANIHNLFAVILGNKTDIQGGSGKVVNSGPNDYIFIFYSDHGGPGSVMMPTDELLYAKDLIEVLKKKHTFAAYKTMVIYLEACESGSMFDGLLTEDLNIYATTAANPFESSYGFYCPGLDPPPPPSYDVCLGDLYSISWLEDSDKADRAKETLELQYNVVKNRTGSAFNVSSHVMQYGNLNFTNATLSVYMGVNPSGQPRTSVDHQLGTSATTAQAVDQRDIYILYLKQKARGAAKGSENWAKAQEELAEEIARRNHEDHSVQVIGEILFGSENAAKVLNSVRPAGQPLVDDWDCLKALVDIYGQHCGSLSRYGIKYMHAFANMCNARVRIDQMAQASAKACI